MTKPKTSKELKDIMDAVKRYAIKHEGRVVVHASFIAFDKNDKWIDNAERMWAYGKKDCIKLSLKGMAKQINDDKEDFICW